MGITTIMAISFGIIKKRGGTKPIVVSASISSLTRMVPSSAAKAEPARPVAIIATIKGPNSLTIERPTKLAT